MVEVTTRHTAAAEEEAKTGGVLFDVRTELFGMTWFFFNVEFMCFW